MPATVSLLVHQYRNRNPLRTLWFLFSGNRASVFGAVAVATLKHIPFLLLPVITARVIDVVGNPQTYPLWHLWAYAGVMAFFLLENIPMHSTFVYLLSRGIRSMEASLRGALVRRMQELSIAFHEEFRSGALHSKVLRDVESVEGLSRNMINVVYIGVINLGFAFTITLRKEPLIAVLFFVVAPLAGSVLTVFRTRIRESNREFRTAIEQMSARVSEMIEMIPITRAHGVEQAEIRRMDSQLHDVKKKGIRLDFVNALFGASSWVSFQLFQFSSLVVSGYLAYRGRITVGDVVMYQGLFAMVMMSVQHLIGVYPDIAKGFESIRSMGEILECPDIERNQGKAQVRAVRGAYAFERVWFAYEQANATAVSDFSLTVAPGESIALVGESGSGKSTIMSLVVGFRRPTAGRILLDDVDTATLDLRTYRQFLSVVPQQTILFSGSIRDNITYGLGDVPDEKVRSAVETANAAEFVDALPHGLDTSIGEHGARLSGGQRQRIAIARALVRDPRVIIFDEATSALDVISEKLVQEAINRLMQNRTTFIVAHRLSTIRTVNRIVVMKQGRCVEIGSHEELMALQGEYHRLRSLQV